MRNLAIVVVVIITAYGVFKLNLLHPVLAHHYHPRGRKEDVADDEDGEDNDGEGPS